MLKPIKLFLPCHTLVVEVIIGLFSPHIQNQPDGEMVQVLNAYPNLNTSEQE